MRIDVHAHYHPPNTIDLLNPMGRAANVADAISDLDVRIADMDARGIDIQLVCVPPWLGEYELADCKRLNEGIAEAVATYPTRLVGLATVPLHEPEQATAELERCVVDLGFRGAEILTNARGENLHQPKFGIFFAKMQELNVPAFIHPQNVLGGHDRLGDFYMANFVGNPHDTGIAAASLIFGGVLAEFPRSKFVLAHGGGSCPFLVGRWDHGWRSGVATNSTIPNAPSEYLRKLHFDTITHDRLALEYLIDKVGADHVHLGTDYPFVMGDQDPVGSIMALGRTADEREAVLGGNAAELFGIG